MEKTKVIPGAASSFSSEKPKQSRKELEKEIAALVKAMDEAVKAKDYCQCSDLQAKIDDLEKMKATLPTAGELDAKIKVPSRFC